MKALRKIINIIFDIEFNGKAPEDALPKKINDEIMEEELVFK